MARAGRVDTILIAEDDDDDFLLTVEAIEEAAVPCRLQRVKDGEELIAYLRHSDKYRDPSTSPAPALVILDLNMPRKDGREALREIKEDVELRRIPVVILTTSNFEEDVARSYSLGANSFMKKPSDFQGLVESMRILGSYWLQSVELPPAP
jgi:CheY-like chemotaxis protein